MGFLGFAPQAGMGAPLVLTEAQRVSGRIEPQPGAVVTQFWERVAGVPGTLIPPETVECRRLRSFNQKSPMSGRYLSLGGRNRRPIDLRSLHTLRTLKLVAFRPFGP